MGGTRVSVNDLFEISFPAHNRHNSLSANVRRALSHAEIKTYRVVSDHHAASTRVPISLLKCRDSSLESKRRAFGQYFLATCCNHQQ